MPDFRHIDEWLQIKELVLIALFSDDVLMSRLVLKGGNALAIAYGLKARASLDLDFSIEGVFTESELTNIEQRVEMRLRQTLNRHDMEVFDLRFSEKPPETTVDLAEFWGGYEITFKIIDRHAFERLKSNQNALSRNAATVGPNHKRVLKVDISKHEYCENKRKIEIRGYRCFVYSQQMLVAEKLRAICQQMPEYRRRVKSQERQGRARDFYDIYALCQKFNLAPTADLATMAKNAFDLKRVDWHSLTRIGDQREIHEANFQSLRDTVDPRVELESFGFYFDWVTDLASQLHMLWHE